MIWTANGTFRSSVWRQDGAGSDRGDARMTGRQAMIPGQIEHLNTEYSPSAWSKRFKDRDLVIQHHLRHVESESAKTIEQIQCELNIKYGEGDQEKLDIFGTDLQDDAPILIFIHGGYWHELSREQSRYFVKPLHNIGVKTVVVGYDLCPKVTLKRIVEQIEYAVRYIFRYAKEKGSKAIYLLGHSAGGHLVAKLLSHKSFLNSISNLNILHGAFLVSAIFDLTELVLTDENRYLNLTNEEAKSLSPQFQNYFHLRNLNLRLHILVAEHDSYTFKRQSRNFYDMLMECCQVQNIHFEIKDKLDHFDIMESLSEPENYLEVLLIEDLSKHLS